MQPLDGDAKDHDPGELIHTALATLFDAGDVIELRAPKTRRGTASGYYRDRHALARDALKLESQAPGVYVTMNRPDPTLYARSCDRFRFYASDSTSDRDILARRWVLIDCDAVRPTGISTTDEEHAAALERANAVVAWLVAAGVPAEALAIADSGNGAHVLLRVELPADAKALRLVRDLLAVVDLYHSDGRVKIDTAVANAARIVRLYGTLARKGDSTTERPHRRSRLLRVAKHLSACPREVLGRLAGMPKPAAVDRQARPADRRFDLEDFIARHLEVAHVKHRSDGVTVWVLARCPWRAEHFNRAAYVLRQPSGAIAAGCLHDSCRGESWHTLRERLEPRRCDQQRRGSGDWIGLDGGNGQPRRAQLVALSSIAPERVAWLWEPRIARGKLTILQGDPGAGKTWMALNLAALISRGGKWPDGGTIELGAVLYLTAEDGLGDTIRPRLDAMGANCDLIHTLQVEHAGVTLRDLDILADAMAQVHPVLLVCDPIQAYLGEKIDMHRANEVRPVLAGVARLGERYGCAALLVAHMTKGGRDRALYRQLGSIDIPAAARSVLLAGCDPANPDQRALVQIKSSCGPLAPGLGYAIEAPGLLRWTGETTLTAATILAAEASPEARDALAFAVEWLAERLGTHYVPQLLVDQESKKVGIKRSTLYRAKTELGVKSRRSGGLGAEGHWYWYLPSATVPDADEETGVVA